MFSYVPRVEAANRKFIPSTHQRKNIPLTYTTATAVGHVGKVLLQLLLEGLVLRHAAAGHSYLVGRLRMRQTGHHSGSGTTYTGGGISGQYAGQGLPCRPTAYHIGTNHRIATTSGATTGLLLLLMWTTERSGRQDRRQAQRTTTTTAANVAAIDDVVATTYLLSRL